MKNIKTYEVIKKELVEEILENYHKYKDLLNQFYNEVKSGQDMYVLNTTIPISKQTSGKRTILFESEEHTENETFKWKMENLKSRFEYISRYLKAFEDVKDARNDLIVAVKDLSVLNNLTSDKKTGINAGQDILQPITKKNSNKNLGIYFRNMEQIKWEVENHIESDYNTHLRVSWLVSLQNGSYVINDEDITERERNFFDKTLEGIRLDLEQLEQIENRIESRNFLKYYLLFK
ncbi:TPA: hypothetical protein ACF9K4_002762 [Staphylococcus aureus]|uniref:hypothetical protein n=1 Tax=Staphylococcus TaxID=1279 RepID=UPI00044929E2|nr:MULTISPECIES: hypothetical protein [Staphylococcus]MDV0205723.1 hypothetical protein [Staphylococcus aureus]EUR16375.1 hypothetical protein T686_02746 [Staphylococcus aureus SJUD6056]MDK7754072.1 hypothetical protein [Staphylococcus sp. UMB10092B]CAC5966916.1 Uncharacterised protein [Staphylococcus aureus]HCZ9450661.1 hypothetical protein [Staphylococcus aureus]